ncbi:GNAT family N-acetyltransferase [Kribbella sp. NPDC051770]|uniref:GNAT family N-acetyltransferase n=1 Tax=Kribbella sp. NPDC051770 TaxID=3155413 RepID=UPI003413DF6B
MPTATDLAAYSLPRQHPMTRSWVADDVRLGLLAEQHELDVTLANDLEIARRRAEVYAPGQPAELLLNRWTPVGDLHAMLSMRYEGGDAVKPFVDATPLTRAVRAADLVPLATAARAAYGVLGPRYLRLWSSEPLNAFEGTHVDRRFLAAPTESLRGREIPPELSFAPAANLDNYPRAVAAYAAIDAAHPDHPDQAKIETAEDLAESVAAGLLYDVLVDNEWAGYVGAHVNDETLGLPAYVVQEFILDPAYRGRGYGRYLPALLAEALPDDRPILLGVIHADNRSALEAANASGRIDVGGWFQVPL